MVKDKKVVSRYFLMFDLLVIRGNHILVQHKLSGNGRNMEILYIIGATCFVMKLYNLSNNTHRTN